MTALQFNRSLQRLNGLKFAPATLETHREALADLEVAELEAAVTRAARECDEFPSPKMLRSFVDEYRRDLPVPDEDLDRERPTAPRTIETPWGTTFTFTREWTYYCEDCSDSGMRSYWCGDEVSARFPTLPLVRCQTPKCELIRRGGGYSHEWVAPCPCAETNPDVLRKKARAAQVIRKQTER